MQRHENISGKNENRQIESTPSIGPAGISTINTPGVGDVANITAAGGAAGIEGAQQNINNLLQQGITGAKNVQQQLGNTAGDSGAETSSSSAAGESGGGAAQSNATPFENIEKTSVTLENINKIKEALATLPLDPTQLVYYNTCISPLLTTLGVLGTLSDDLATSVSILTVSPIVCNKHHKLKDTIHLIYDVNEKCEDIFRELDSRIDILLELGVCWDLGKNSCIKDK